MQKLELKVKGLYLSPNDYSSVPEGALLEASNCVLDKESVLESRRGQTFYSDDALADIPTSLFNYNDKILLYAGTSLLHDDGTGTFTAYSGAYSPPDTGYKIRGIEANRNFYFLTSVGTKKLDSLTGTVKNAGAPPGLDISGTLDGLTGFLGVDSAVAYRILWGYRDANNNLIIGAPSQRFEISKEATPLGTKNVKLTFTVPSGIDTSWFYQIYRSETFQPATAKVDDELYLVYEGNYVSGATVTVIDATPDTLVGSTLYTSPSQQGIENANNPPPFARDICLFNNMTLYANTQNKQRMLVTYLGGMALDSTVTVAGTTYTAKATENIASRQFALATTGTPAENIEDTALSLVRVINQYTGNTAVYAYYLSGYEDLPGKMSFEERIQGGAAFYMTSSAGSSFNPVVPVSGTTFVSSNDARQNGISISKVNQPEAVPLYAYVFVGSANKPIRRILALRDSVFIFKDDGIFRLTGNDFSTVVVSLFDGSKKLWAYESPVVFDNQIFCFVDQGVAAVSEQGVQIISKPIENRLLMVSQYSNFKDKTFGVGYDSDRKYFLWTVESKNDSYATVAYVWNSVTMAWTTWDLSRTCGMVLSGVNKLYMGNPENDYVYVERKTLTRMDYADESYSVTITAKNEDVVTLNDSTNVEAGDALTQGDQIALVISKIGLDVLVDRVLPWELDYATIDKPFTVRATFCPAEMENPQLVKHFSECAYFFKEALWSQITAAWTSSYEANEYIVLSAPSSATGFGDETFGEEVYGGVGSVAGRMTIRTYLPLNISRANWITSSLELTEPFANLSLMGMGYLYTPMSTKLVAE